MSTARIKYLDQSKLKDKEIKAVKLYLMGYSFRRIGEILNIAYVTANNYVRTAKEKLSVNTFDELADKVVEVGIMSAEELEEALKWREA